MVAWGAGPFDSDDACEFVDYIQQGDLPDLRRTMKFDSSDDDSAYAAAAIIAAAQGQCVEELPVELAGALPRFRKQCQPKDIDQAIGVVESLKKDSALRQLWKESGGTEPLMKELNKLLKLLRAKPQELPPPHPRAPWIPPRLRRSSRVGFTVSASLPAHRHPTDPMHS